MQNTKNKMSTAWDGNAQLSDYILSFLFVVILWMDVCVFFFGCFSFSARWFLRFWFDDLFFPPNSRREIAHWHCGFVTIVNKTQNATVEMATIAQIERLTFIWFLCSFFRNVIVFFSINETFFIKSIGPQENGLLLSNFRLPCKDFSTFPKNLTVK